MVGAQDIPRREKRGQTPGGLGPVGVAQGQERREHRGNHHDEHDHRAGDRPPVGEKTLPASRRTYAGLPQGPRLADHLRHGLTAVASHSESWDRGARRASRASGRGGSGGRKAGPVCPAERAAGYGPGRATPPADKERGKTGTGPPKNPAARPPPTPPPPPARSATEPRRAAATIPM